MASSRANELPVRHAFSKSSRPRAVRMASTCSSLRATARSEGLTPKSTASRSAAAVSVEASW